MSIPFPGCITSEFIAGPMLQQAFPFIPHSHLAAFTDPRDSNKQFSLATVNVWRGLLNSPAACANALLENEKWFALADEAGRTASAAWPLLMDSVPDEYVRFLDLGDAPLWTAIVHSLGSEPSREPRLLARRMPVLPSILLEPGTRAPKSRELRQKPLDFLELWELWSYGDRPLPPVPNVVRWWSALEPGCYAASAIAADYLAEIVEGASEPLDKRARGGAAEEVALVVGSGDNGDTKPKTLPAVAEAIDECDAIEAADLSLLRFLNKAPKLRRPITEIIPDEGPADRKAISLRLRAMANRPTPLVDYDVKRGVAILPAGIAMVVELTAPKPP